MFCQSQAFSSEKNKNPDFDCFFDFQKKSEFDMNFKNAKLATLHETTIVR